MRIAFIENHLNVRGTSVAMYDYAHFNETLLGNESFIITRPYHMVANNIDVDENIYKKFQGRFNVRYYNQTQDINAILKEEKADAAYVIKSGDPGDGISNFSVPLFVHAVFQPRCPHGNMYAAISEWLNIQYKTSIPVLPHMVTLPSCDEDLRDALHIPKDSIVFGRYGGYDTFDIPMTQRAVERVSRENPSLYFLFMHTQPFCSPRHNIIHLPRNADMTMKTKFINTCDAMIYGRKDGETFGLSIGEFSIKNKPVFAICEYPGMECKMHKLILQDRAFWYTSEEELVTKLTSFTSEVRDKCRKEDWNMYKQYSPENVMAIFSAYFTNMVKK